jgi:large subunit ribosomal protein L5
MEATAMTARLKTRYLEEIRPQLLEQFDYSSVMQAPQIEKITLNMGVGDAKQDAKVLKAAREQLATIAGQQPSVRRARKSIAAFKLREGNPVGVSVTLRGERAYEFLDRLISIAIPRIRDFRGLNPRSFDGRGNYSMGVREQIIFPEIDYDAIDEVRGLDITITTTAASDAEAFALLLALGVPFAAQGRPAGFDQNGAQAQANGGAGAASEADGDEATGGDEPAATATDETAEPTAGAEEEPQEPTAGVGQAQTPTAEPDEAAEPTAGAEEAEEPTAGAEEEARGPAAGAGGDATDDEREEGG